MSSRREFSRKQRAEIILRATDGDGIVCCEGCGLRLHRKPYEIDHIVAEALIMDKSAPLRIEDGQLLGKECCHRGGKTADDIRMIRKADRQRDKHTGAFPKTRNPIAGSRSTPWKRRFRGPMVLRAERPHDGR